MSALVPQRQTRYNFPELRLINRFFVYTSMTYYWARYKAPGVGLKDFKRAKPPA